ncbi:MAG: cache domain-containing protein [Deltaproteobacteria bacterium]|nr:cache domain-containing protein [Deltaproteobacteria bacterium]
MRKSLTAALCICLLFGSIVYAEAEGGTAEEAKALVDDAVALIQESGQDEAFAAFNDTAGDYVMKDLYIFVVDMSGTILAHGAKASLIGKNLMSLQDKDGKFIIKDMIEMAKTQSEGWVDYKWENPMTKSIGNKSTYFRKVKDILVCCGVYR